jgi:hypothetical protein
MPSKTAVLYTNRHDLQSRFCVIFRKSCVRVRPKLLPQQFAWKIRQLGMSAFKENPMRIDPFTKLLLLAIALFLGMIALRPYTGTDEARAGAGDFDHVRYMGRFGIGNQSGNVFMDARTGELYGYGFGSKSDVAPEILFLGRLSRLGDPLAGR